MQGEAQSNLINSVMIKIYGFFFFCVIVYCEFGICLNWQVLYESENNGCDTFELSQIIEMEVEKENKNKNAELFSLTDSVHSNENNNSFNNLDEYNSPFGLNLKHKMKDKMKHKRKRVPRRSPFF